MQTGGGGWLGEVVVRPSNKSNGAGSNGSSRRKQQQQRARLLERLKLPDAANPPGPALATLQQFAFAAAESSRGLGTNPLHNHQEDLHMGDSASLSAGVEGALLFFDDDG